MQSLGDNQSNLEQPPEGNDGIDWMYCEGEIRRWLISCCLSFSRRHVTASKTATHKAVRKNPPKKREKKFVAKIPKYGLDLVRAAPPGGYGN